MSYVGGDGGSSDVDTDEVTGWVGWIAFAAIMMALVGSFHAMAGLVALFKDEYYLVGRSGLVVNVSYTTWGWVHLLMGVVMVVGGLFLIAGQMWARILAVLVAFVSTILNLAFLSAYPIWSTIMIAVDVLVIYAVCVHGRELQGM
jgi:hypothetical protein